jgi:hypothetical protein
MAEQIFEAPGITGSGTVLDRARRLAKRLFAPRPGRDVVRPPSDGLELMWLLDGARRRADPDLFMRTAHLASQMPYVPKEALYLARHGRVRNADDRDLLARLERMGDAADVQRAQDRAVTGAVEDRRLIVSGVAYEISPASGGWIEYAMELDRGLDTAGWAGDVTHNRPAVAIVAAVDGRIAASSRLIGERPDIEAGYGDGIRPAKFSLWLPVQPRGDAQLPLVELFALTADGRALPLATGLPDKPNMRFAKR